MQLILHLEIVIERLEREFDIGLITTAPSVIYKINKTSGEVITEIKNVDLNTKTNKNNQFKK